MSVNLKSIVFHDLTLRFALLSKPVKFLKVSLCETFKNFTYARYRRKQEA